MSKSRGNFAALLVQQLYARHERITSNVMGTRGKRQLSPRRMNVVRRLSFQMYPPASSKEEDTIWKKECVKAIDSKNRKVRITPRGSKVSLGSQVNPSPSPQQQQITSTMPPTTTTTNTPTASTSAAEAYTKYLNQLNPSSLAAQQLPGHLSRSAASTAAIAAIAAAAMAAAATKPPDPSTRNIPQNYSPPNNPSPPNLKSPH